MLLCVRYAALSGRKTCDAVLRKGSVWKGKTMIIHWMPGKPRNIDPAKKTSGVFVGTFASSKLSKSAVERNRMRRRVREALRLTLRDMDSLQPVQLLLCPRIASLDSPFELLVQDARMFLSTFA